MKRAGRLSRDAISLYFFLTAVSDRHGLSFYYDTSIAIRLRLTEQVVADARDELINHDLIAFDPPITQVLSLPRPSRVARAGLQALGELFRSVSEEDSPKE